MNDSHHIVFFHRPAVSSRSLRCPHQRHNEDLMRANQLLNKDVEAEGDNHTEDILKDSPGRSSSSFEPTRRGSQKSDQHQH